MLILALAIPVVFHGSYNYLRAFEIFPILTLIMVIGIIYYYRQEQLKKITESVEKERIENIDVFYAYGLSLLLVILVVFSAMSFA